MPRWLKSDGVPPLCYQVWDEYAWFVGVLAATLRGLCCSYDIREQLTQVSLAASLWFQHWLRHWSTALKLLTNNKLNKRRSVAWLQHALEPLRSTVARAVNAFNAQINYYERIGIDRLFLMALSSNCAERKGMNFNFPAGCEHDTSMTRSFFFFLESNAHVMYTLTFFDQIRRRN